MMFIVYVGSLKMQKISAIIYCLRIIMIVFWGAYLMATKDYKIGEQIANNDQLVSLYFTIFITVRELILLPVLITKAYFKTKYNYLALSQIRRYKMNLRR